MLATGPWILNPTHIHRGGTLSHAHSPVLGQSFRMSIQAAPQRFTHRGTIRHPGSVEPLCTAAPLYTSLYRAPLCAAPLLHLSVHLSTAAPRCTSLYALCSSLRSA